MMAADQQERMSDVFYSADPKEVSRLAKRETARARELFKLLATVKTPSVRNIGLDGSRAVWLIALHNTGYRGLGKAVLQKMKQLYYRDKNQVFHSGIPYLVDMVMLETKGFDHSTKQMYGTRHWVTRDANGHIERGSFPVMDVKHLAERREKFGIVGIVAKCRHYR